MNFDISTNEKLKHLDPDSIEELMNLYYESTKNNKELINLFNIDIKNPSSLYTLFPPQKLENEFCPYCGGNLYIKRPSKTSKLYNSPKFCPNCKHIESEDCNCEFCIEKRHLYEENRRNLIIDAYSINESDKLNISDISFRNKVYLSSLLRICLSEDLSTIYPLENYKLSPSIDFNNEIIRTLYNDNIIKVHPLYSSLDSFTSNDERNYPEVFKMYKVHYFLNVTCNNSNEQTINELLYKNYFTEDDIEDAYLLWKKIALEECLEYLLFNMDKVKFEFSPGKKTILLFDSLLNNFSVSEIYSIIYSGISSASRYYLEGNVSKKRAANSVISRCQTIADKMILGDWNAHQYKRPYSLPQSAISEFFFNKVLEIGDKGFNCPPSIDILMDCL